MLENGSALRLTEIFFRSSEEKLNRHGALSKQTMREFDTSCLCQAGNLSPEDIRNLRERENVSQSIFARYLNVFKN